MSPFSPKKVSKRKMIALKQEIEELKGAEIQHRETLRENIYEIESLKEQLCAAKEANETENEPDRKRIKEALETQFMRAGKKYAVMQNMWMSTGALELVSDIACTPAERPEPVDEDENSEILLEEALCIYESLPSHLKRHATDTKLLKEFKTGHGDIKSTDVFQIARHIPYIFPSIAVSLNEFINRTTRSESPAIAQLLENHQFLYNVDFATASAKARLDAHMRGPTILSVLKGVLFGPTAMATGVKSTKARKCNAILWNVTSITPELLAYAATAIKFVLSGEKEFGESGEQIDFKKFYTSRVDMLTADSSNAQRKRAQDLLQYYNKALFPEHHTITPIHDDMNPEERAIREAMEAERLEEN